MVKLKDRKKNLKVLSSETKKGETCEVDQSDIRENEEHQEEKNLSKKKRKISQSVGDGFAGDIGKDNKVKESYKKRPKKSRSKEKKSLVNKADIEAENKPRNVLTKGKSKKAKRKESNHLPTESENILTMSDGGGDDVHHISSGDEDCSKGMKKWIMDYHQQRPGLKELQKRIDDFISAHEEKEEQEKQEREARAGEDGWTVVTHHKGRKKTTEAETGVVVGSVTQAAVHDKMAKKKNKYVGLDFYRFQRREVHKNEILMLQSKFEQDKKRIQQMRAMRKFQPY